MKLINLTLKLIDTTGTVTFMGVVYIYHLGNGWSGHPSVVDIKQLEGVVVVTYDLQTSLTNSVTKGIL